MSHGRISWRARALRGATAVALAVVVAGSSATGASATTAPHPAGGPVVVTSNGAVRGATTTNDTNEFLGLPYAAPPVGPLRWRPPASAASWHGVRAATTFAPHCSQPGGPFGVASTSEDCLYLNVFAAQHPANPLRPRPVMVWIHGGALVTGESDDYNPASLVRDGTVVVTINYRLGALGFLAHPALADKAGGPSGDYGLMDQQAALRWVQRNIRAFGGDPGDVTIFGESAGGLSVLSQLASSGAKGLFDRAVVESGAYNLTQASLATAEADGQAFAANVGCASQTAACLRGVPAATLVANEGTGYTPDIDGRVLTESLKTSFADGRFNRVPVVNGSNHDEYRLFVALSELEGAPVTAANYQAAIASTLGVPAATAAAIVAQYPLSAYPSPALALSALGTDAIFSCGALSVDRSVSRFVPTYAYEFNDENAPQTLLPPVDFPYGAAHASEIQYLFDANANQTSALNAAQQRLAGTMQGYWTTFAGRGAPSSLGSPLWPPFSGTTQRIQSLDTPRPQVETDFATEHNCAFWAQVG